MQTTLNRERTDPSLSKWNALPLTEKKRQFTELIHSPYWHFLPEEIKDRLHRLIAPGEEH